ncbi:Ig-like domain-containing protein [Ekhidna lutea]|uniref:Ig-like domain-containing protein n=1 Tax=Ekhidna lutea TaxID=447679 RepID=A0A239ENT1_EKHLU|nr:Ig-like domain-containing protein [Ekhidna lutea]SNS46297.1 Ig-like domain-containing protein [Ekhidna lutea]
MKDFITIILFIIFIDITFHQCANPGRPTGGPKDTIPPTLIYANPVSGTTNFNSSEIELEFSEFITADKLKQQLIITPKTDINYKSIAKRNKLIIKLEGELEDSTTYNFNFADGVTDITENNPAINLSIAFSTGQYIDSLSIKGSVEQLLTKEPGKEFVVGLYPFSDSLDFFSENPMYFTTANDSGNYVINYIKKGVYKILAFNDDNSNFILDPETEAHGFLQDTIRLDSSTILPPIRTILQNVKPIKLINARPAGPYLEIKFNKTPDEYSITPDYLYHQVVGDKKDVLRVYKPDTINYGDSLQSIIYVKDSLNNEIKDTINYVFLQSNRKPSSFTYSIKESKLFITDSNRISLKFNKPIKSSDSSKFYIQADSTFSLQVFPKSKWNHNFTTLDLQFKWSPDSIFAAYEKTLPRDTTAIDSLSNDPINQSISAGPKQPALKLIIDKGGFVSVENDTSAQKALPLSKPTKQSAGVLKLTVQTDETHFTIQLIDENGKVAYQKSNEKNITFNTIKPSNYTVRALIDDNKDGKWSYGNLLKNQEPEQIFLYRQETSIRENWVVELGITF